jgi:hypothetical protein
VLEVCNAGALLALDLLDFEASEIWTHLNSRFLNVLASPKCLLTGVRVAPLPYVMHATLYAHDIYIYMCPGDMYIDTFKCEVDSSPAATCR